MQQKELSYSDIQWILEKLPQDIITTIILSYNPESLYILSDDTILKHDWRKQCQLTFNLNIPDSKTEDWLRIYYNLSQRSKHKNIACGRHHTIILKTNGVLMSTGSNQYGQLGIGNTGTNIFTEVPNIHSSQTAINSSKDIVAIACGDSHTVILRENGVLMSTGLNQYGQLGLGDTKDRDAFTEVSNIISSERGLSTLPKDIVAISCGGSHTVILRANGS